jgi:ribosome-associated protein
MSTLPPNTARSSTLSPRVLEARRALRLPLEALLSECQESFFIASGPGGQHRNKTESGVRLEHARTEVSVTATERRSQAQNRSIAVERLLSALRQLSVVPKVRRATKPTFGSKVRRLDQKKRVSAQKQSRKAD